MFSAKISQFDRFELKYLVDRAQYGAMVAALRRHMTPDPRGDEHGGYTITSLYYDTPDYKAYWDKLEGHRFRRKVRLRVYGEQTVTPETPCFAEIKQRINKTLQKKRVLLPHAAAVQLCELGEAVTVHSEADQAVVEEILYLYHTLQLQPACLISYNRLAFNGGEYDAGLRVTFDTNLKCRGHDLTLLSQGRAENHFFLPPHWAVLEIKVNDRVPYWLTELIGQHRCTLRRISKYCAALEQAKLVLSRQQIFS